MATTGGLTGGLAGLALGFPSCAERRKDVMLGGVSCLFGDKGLVYGTYTGSFAGAALGAGKGAIRAGCPAKEGWKRSFLGSLAGSLPALGYLAAGSSNSEDVQNAFLTGTPILQIVGATAAVSNCRILRRG